MKRTFLFLACLILPLAAVADTVQQRVDALANAANVIGVSREAEPTMVLAGLGKLRVTYASTTGSIAEIQVVDLLVVNFGEQNKAAFWLSRVPAPLVVTPPVVYISDRTVGEPITAAQIQSFCNAQWRAQAGHSAAADIRKFSVVPVDGKSVQVSGWFNVIPQSGAATWERRAYLIRMIDPNGNPSGSNIWFERVTVE